MLKKIVLLFLVLCLLSPGIASLAEEPDDRVLLLNQLGILSGYEDGTYRLDATLTRAEFTKITVAASENRKAVSAALAVSPYSDVPHTLWSAPYIHLAAQKGYVTGYLDSTFRPDASISYAEAVAVFLRLLGYQNSDFGAAWPRGHMALAEDIGLLSGIQLAFDAPLPRLCAVTLLYNLLGTPIKGSTKEYITLLECTAYEDTVVQATSAEDSTISSSRVLTTAGTFKKGDAFQADWIGRTGKLFIKDGNTVAAFVPDVQTVRAFPVTGTAGSALLLEGKAYNWAANMPVYFKSGVTPYSQIAPEAEDGATFTVFCSEEGTAEYALLQNPVLSENAPLLVETVAVYSVLQDGIITYKDGNLKKVPLSDGVPLYEDETRVGTLSKSGLQMGDLLNIVYDEKEKVDYVVRTTDGFSEPLTVQNESWQSAFPLSASTLILRDGRRVSPAEIETYDILYYAESLDMLLAYTDTVQGVYKSASPSKDTPNMVTVSGKEYTIESLTAFHKLATGGSFAFGDTVTLLLGRGGAVADVLPVDASTSMVGILSGAGTATYETEWGDAYTGYTLSLTDAEGATHTFEAKQDYDTLLNHVVSLSFSDGKAIAKPIEGSSVSGTIDSSALTLGTHSLSPSINIVELYAPDAYTAGKTGSVFLQRLDGVKLTSSQILYAARDNQSRISALFLSDVTGDLHQYGIVTKAETRSLGVSVSGTYEYMIGSTPGVLQTSGRAFSVASGAPARFSQSGGKIYTISPLTMLPGVVSALTDGQIRLADGTFYPIDDATLYIRNSDYTYLQKQISDIDASAYTIRAYYDKTLASGGKIRVLVATK